MKNIKEILFDAFTPAENIFEMATISKAERWGNDNYKIAIHGTAKGDRETPHIHIYMSSDRIPYNQFNFEISLVDILCYDEINLIYQRDRKTNKFITNRLKCSWNGYKRIKDGFEDWLFDKCKLPGEFKDNLDAIIWYYNNESNLLTDNPLKDYLDSRGFIVLDKYKHYFE